MFTTFVASLALVAGGVNATPTHPFIREGKPCAKVFNDTMGRRAILAVYSGSRDVTPGELHMLGRIERCQRDATQTRGLRKFDRRTRHQWWMRRHPKMFTQLASWYTDAGGTACGFHATYGVANKALPCGTHVIARYHGRQITMVIQDRGPYVGDRRWDLNQGSAAALGFSGVGYIQVSVYSPY